MKKLHNHRYPAGLEWTILKTIPKALFGAIFVPVFMSIIVRLYPISGGVAEVARYQHGIDILAIALCVTALTAIFTLTIGCVIVSVMKGPAYVADAYELNDADRPEQASKHDKQPEQ
jgi:uncharacterized membrane-anchored protein YitT (DUF2179 family)